jgi:chromosome segregation ATPase
MINAQLSPPPGFQASVQTTGSSINSIDIACQNVQNMPVYSSPYAPTLPQDISNAKTVASQWSSTIRQQVIASLQGILNFNNLFQSKFSELYSISEQIATGSTSQIPAFQADLTQLQQATEAEENQVNLVQNSLTNYLVQIDDIMRALNNDNNELQNAVNGLSAQMQNLEQQMNQIQKKIDDESSNPFSKLWYELTGQLDDLKKEQSQIENELNSTNQQLYQAQNALHTITSYQNSFGQIQGGINGLATGWESLNADLKETLSDEDITDYNAFTPALVQAASADWQQVANLAQSFI